MFGSKHQNPKIQSSINRVNSPKHALMNIVQDLRAAGANRKANSLDTIIRNLEHWQWK